MIPNIFDNPAGLRMGWALIHLLWQGTLIALALKGALMLLEPRCARLRYALALACLFLMAALPVYLLCKPQRTRPDIPTAYETALVETPSINGTPSTTLPIDRRLDLSAQVSHLLTPLVSWIAAGWVIGAALLLLKTLGGVIRVRVLKREAAAHSATKETAPFHRLAARAGVAGVTVLESGLVSIPTVAGWFQPVVLLPQGVLEKADRPMLDALVAHEFAHIRRHDSVMNLLQAVIEDLLFFHPAMWWITRNVRAEREACCDDNAVAMCGDTLVYVRALSRAERFRSSMPVVALSGSPLLQRIRRLTEMKTSKMNHATALCVTLLAVSCIIIAAAGSMALATIPPQNSASSIAANKPGSDQDLAQTKPEAGAIGSTSPDQEAHYALLCGLSFGTRNRASAEPVHLPPPPTDGKTNQGTCILLDVSTPKAARVSGELQASKLIRKIAPLYPEPALKEHVGIRVVLRVYVDDEGRVTDAEVTKSQTVPPDRDSAGHWVGGVPAGVIRSVHGAAIHAVKQWKYSPTLLDSKAIPVMATVSIDFTFDRDGSPRIITYAP